MEIMEDGNLVDRVRILLQRDMQYYEQQQTVLLEPLCIRVSGGKFDFPRHASFAGIKIATWWEAEFAIAFGRSSGLKSASRGDEEIDENGDEVVKTTQPSEFISMVVETSEQFLEHLHTLIQESLDHADLTVLTAALGAAALIRNCLWCYNKQTKNEIPPQTSGKLQKCYEDYNEIAEAVAERLLDLHCRLISLYILNEADSLSWHSQTAFYEKKRRCSYIIQMWWLYMQGTKTDLWNTVSPKMAKRIFSGMLNESLSIIVARFIHGRPSLARTSQFWLDAFVVLCCTTHLSLSCCFDASEMIALHARKLSVHVRDIHAKCNELIVCMLLRGAPLKYVFQVFRKGLDDLTISKPRNGPSPWIFVNPSLFGASHLTESNFKNLTIEQVTILELRVLESQPQPNFTQLVKILSMNNYSVAKIFLEILTRECLDSKIDHRLQSGNHSSIDKNEDNCGGFLCTGRSCQKTNIIAPEQAFYCLTYILTNTSIDQNKLLVPALKKDSNWSNFLDRQQVWNQARPPWLNALLTPLLPLMMPIAQILLDAAKTGASTYQTMSLALTSLEELNDCMPLGILQTALAMDENIPAHCRPIGGSVVLQFMISALYSALLDLSERPNTGESCQANAATQGNADEVKEKATDNKPAIIVSNATESKKMSSDLALALAEALCGIDEDNKHTGQIETLLNFVRERVALRIESSYLPEVENMRCVIEMHADEVAFAETGRLALKVIHEYLIRVSKDILEILRSNGKKMHPPPMDSAPLGLLPLESKVLTHLMYNVGDVTFDDLFVYYETMDWELLFEIPMSLSVERIRSQVLSRPELQNILQLMPQEREAANFIKKLCTTGHLQ